MNLLQTQFLCPLSTQLCKQHIPTTLLRDGISGVLLLSMRSFLFTFLLEVIREEEGNVYGEWSIISQYSTAQNWWGRTGGCEGSVKKAR
jgi:hypothetical protein